MIQNDKIEIPCINRNAILIHLQTGDEYHLILLRINFLANIALQQWQMPSSNWVCALRVQCRSMGKNGLVIPSVYYI